MKKLICVVALGLLFLGAGVAHAVPITFTDIWNPSGWVYIGPSSPSYSYQHNILDDGFNKLTDHLTSAEIKLTLMDDSGHDWSEAFSLTLDGSKDYSLEWLSGDGQYKYDVDISYLQSDGLLNVTLTSVYHWDHGFWVLGDFKFDLSELKVCGDRTPVPEPATMLLLGAGLVGLVCARKKLR